MISAPGFSERSFFLLKMKKEELFTQSNSKLVVSLIFDEMHLKKNIHFDGKNFIGGVDLGDEFNTKHFLEKVFICF